jgi:hypothetical protein
VKNSISYLNRRKSIEKYDLAVVEPELDDSLSVEEIIGNPVEQVGDIGSAAISNVSSESRKMKGKRGLLI